MSPEGSSSGLDPLFSRRSLPGMLHPWARAGSRRFPGDPSQAFALLQDPGRADTTSPLAVVPTPPPGHPNRRPQRVHNLEANTGLQLPLSTLHERRHRLPCKTRFRLAGCASTGRVSNPLGRCERFQVTFHSPFQDFSCRKGDLPQGAVRGAGAGPALSLALHPSRRHLQPPIGRRRRQCHRLPVEGLPHRPARPLEDDDALPASVHPPLPDARAAQGLPPDPPHGLFANGNRAANVAHSRELLGALPRVVEPEEEQAATPDEPRVQPCTCPRCGARMIIIEVFTRGCEPRYRPAPPPTPISIDTS